METQIIIVLTIIAAIVGIAPYILSWRISRFGSAVTNEPPSAGTAALYSSWITLKGTRALTRQSILCRMKLYGDRLGMRPLWGPEKFIKLADVQGMERLLSGSRTVGVRLRPRDKCALEEITISGMADVPSFLDRIRNNPFPIEVKEVEERRGVLDFFK